MYFMSYINSLFHCLSFKCKLYHIDYLDSGREPISRTYVVSVRKGFLLPLGARTGCVFTFALSDFGSSWAFHIIKLLKVQICIV